jgi:hypothetical protein
MADIEKEIIWATSTTGEEFQCVHVDFAREQAAEIDRLTNELAQFRSQSGDSIELQEAEQRGFARAADEIERLREFRANVLSLSHNLNLVCSSQQSTSKE